MLSGIGPFFILPAQKNEFRQLSPISVVPALPPGTRFFFRDSVRESDIPLSETPARFRLEKGKTRGGGTVPPGLLFLGKAALFPRNDRPYLLKGNAFQTENTL